MSAIARETVTSIEDEPQHVVVWLVREGLVEAEAFPIHKVGGSADVKLGERVLGYRDETPFEVTLSYLGGGSAGLRQVTGLARSAG